jgi:hypothetical protein
VPLATVTVWPGPVPIKPPNERTGPLNVVNAMIDILHTKLSLLVLYASAGAV